MRFRNSWPEGVPQGIQQALAPVLTLRDPDQRRRSRWCSFRPSMCRDSNVITITVLEADGAARPSVMWAPSSSTCSRSEDFGVRLLASSKRARNRPRRTCRELWPPHRSRHIREATVIGDEWRSPYSDISRRIIALSSSKSIARGRHQLGLRRRGAEEDEACRWAGRSLGGAVAQNGVETRRRLRLATTRP